MGGIANFPGMPTLPGAPPGTVGLPGQVPSVGSDAQAIAEANGALAAGEVDTAARIIGLTPDDMAKIRGAAGVTNQEQLVQAVSGFVNLDTNQRNAVSALAQGDYRAALSKGIQIGGADLGVPPGITTDLIQAGDSMLAGNLLGAIGPLVAMGLAAGGVGAPIIAAVGGAIALGESALVSLGVIKTGPEHCDWKVGGMCFNGIRPYGPTDPVTKKTNPQWVPLSRMLVGPELFFDGDGLGLDPFATTVAYEARFLERLYQLGTTTAGAEYAAACKQTSFLAKHRPLDAFRLAFCRAYLANLEKGINGHPMAGPHEILDQVAYAWNAQHVNTAANAVGIEPVKGTRDLSGMTFQTPGTQATPWNATAIEMILAGQVDGNTEQPLTIYITPPSKPIVFSFGPIHLAPPRPIATAIAKSVASMPNLSLLRPPAPKPAASPVPSTAAALAKEVAPIGLGALGAGLLLRLLLP